MEQELSVKIGADIVDLKKGLNDAEVLLESYTKAVKENKANLNNATRAYNNGKEALSKLENEYKQGKRSVKEYARSTELLEGQLDDAAQNVEHYTREVANSEKKLENAKAANIAYSNSTENVASSSRQAGRSVNNFGNAARGNAVPAMQSFSQVIQDAPYGIQGVANNVQQLTAQFGYLSAQSGGTKAALKGMIGSLMGPAGLLLAISAVTTLLVSFGDKLFNSKTAAEEAAGAYKKAREQLDLFIGSLSELEKLDLEVAVAVDIEARRVRDLFEQALGYEGGGEDVQIAALQVLKESYPELLKNVTAANVEYSDLTKVLKSVNSEYKELSKSQQAQKQWETNRETIAGLERQISSVREELEKTLPKSFWENAEPEEGWERFWDTATLGANKLIRAFTELGKESSLVDKLQSASKEIRRLKDANIDLAGEIGIVVDPNDINIDEESVQNAVDTTSPVPLTLKSVLTIDPESLDLSEIKKKVLNIQDIQKQLEGAQGAYAQGEGQYIRIQGLIDILDIAIKKLREGERLTSQFGQTAASGGAVNFSFSDAPSAEQQLQNNVPSNAEAINAIKEYMAAQNALAANTKATSDQISAYQRKMAMVTEAAFGQMLSSIGNAAIEGELTMDSFAKMFSKMILKIMSTALAGALAQAIFGSASFAASTGAAAPFTLPVTLAGMTGVIKGAFGSIPQFAEGGVVGGHSYTGDKILSRLNSGELILNQAQQKSLLNMTMNPAVIGGGEVFISDTIIKGEDIVIAYERTQRKTNRIR